MAEVDAATLAQCIIEKAVVYHLVERMGVALLTLCSLIAIPTAVPFTLQTFAVCLIAALFSLKAGLGTVACYLLLGALGAPVFSGFRGGVGILLGATGGYLVGFLFTGAVVGFAVRRFGRGFPVLVVSMAVGILICYLFGTLWFMRVYTRANGPVGLGAVLGWCVLPYLIPDALKIVLASLLTRRLKPLTRL